MKNEKFSNHKTTLIVLIVIIVLILAAISLVLIKRNNTLRWAADGSWNGTVNTPKLATGMIAVYWDENNEEINQNSSNFDLAKWYDYSNNKWANAKTEDGSYWVWIPRYEYKIDYKTNGVIQGINEDDSKAGIIDVKFIKTTTTHPASGYIIHPAFTNNVDAGGWDSELSGIWVAKYQMSMEDNNGIHITTSTSAIGNVALSDTVKAVSKPGVSSWICINIANCYENSRNYGDSIGHPEYESHLMKNSEWGAVVYLTHSKYGRNGVEVSINNNTSYLTGGGEGTAYAIANTAQSSTGNPSRNI